MNKEQEEAIEICNKIIQQNKEIVKQTRANNDINSMQLTANCDNESIAIETVLNLIKDQQTEIEGLKNRNKHLSADITKAVDYTFELNKEIENKDKIINELAPRVYLMKEEKEQMKKDIQNSYKEISFSTWVKQYFERKIEQC